MVFGPGMAVGSWLYVKVVLFHGEREKLASITDSRLESPLSVISVYTRISVY